MDKSSSDEKDRPLMTATESKLVGWDDDLIEQYPHASMVRFASRLQLIRWYRFLREPQNGAEAEFMAFVVTELRATCPFTEKPVEPAFDTEVEDAGLGDSELQSIGEMIDEAVDTDEIIAGEVLSELLDGLPADLEGD